MSERRDRDKERLRRALERARALTRSQLEAVPALEAAVAALEALDGRE